MSFGASPCRAVLPGRRRHFQHGPIDLVLEAFGAPEEVTAAYEQAWERFRTILEELVAELPALRRAVGDGPNRLAGVVARRMHGVCRPHRATYVTPMSAVAGAVADAVLASMVDGRRLDRAYVNNGGDIALHLGPGESFTTGVVTLAEAPAFDGLSRISAESPVRGIATSGWRGRSFSLGIADSVTVLAGSAAAADVAATLIANSVNVADPTIQRVPARELSPDSDLEDRLVTVEVGPLPAEKVEQALAAGAVEAQDMAARCLILQALITLQGRSRVVGASESLAA